MVFDIIKAILLPMLFKIVLIVDNFFTLKTHLLYVLINFFVNYPFTFFVSSVAGGLRGCIIKMLQKIFILPHIDSPLRCPQQPGISQTE